MIITTRKSKTCNEVIEKHFIDGIGGDRGHSEFKFNIKSPSIEKTSSVITWRNYQSKVKTSFCSLVIYVIVDPKTNPMKFKGFIAWPNKGEYTNNIEYINFMINIEKLKLEKKP